MDPTELFWFFTGCAKFAYDVPVQVHFIDWADIGIRGVQVLFRSRGNTNSPRVSGVGPHGSQDEFIIENLNAVVLTITYVHISLGVGGNRVCIVELTGG